MTFWGARFVGAQHAWRLAAAMTQCLLVVLVALVAPQAARASEAPSIDAAVDRAVAHLEAVQLPDGGYGSRLALRDTATAGEALRLVRPESPAIAGIDGFLAAADLHDVDSLSRAATGSPAAADADALLAAQREDGGFGLSPEYQSDALDTALALRALTALGEHAAARRAAERLVKFATAGVWGADGGDVALTGEALLALDAYVRRFGSTAALDATRTASIAWLGVAQDDAGIWGSGHIGARVTALAVAALATSLSAVAPVSSGADALLLSQQPDGSWGDPFTTALATRALRRARDLIERHRHAQLPDPSIHPRDVAASPRVVDSGDAVTMSATVTNGGRARTSGVTAEFFLDDPVGGAPVLATVDVPDLDPGERQTVTATFDVDRLGGRAQVHVVVRAPVDADVDLTNNVAKHALYVRIARKAFPRTLDWPRQSRDLQRSGTSPNRLHAVVDSTPIWRAPASGGHVVAEGRVYYGEAGKITARNAKTGALIWHSGFSYTDDRYRTPVYTRGWILTAAEGTAGHLNGRTGELVGGVGGWGGDRPVFSAETIEVEGSPDPAFMYMAHLPNINYGGCHLDPYRDLTSAPYNHTLWTVYFGHQCDGDPLSFAADGPRAFMTNGAWLSSFDPKTGKGPTGETGKPLFDAKLPDMAKVPAAPLVDSLNQIVVAGWEGTSPTGMVAAGTPNGRGKVVAADPATGAPYWTFSTNARLDGTPVEFRGTIIVVDRSGRVYGLDQITGALKWSWMPGDYVPPAPEQQGKSGQTLAISGRHLYVPHPDGKLYTLDVRDGSQLSATALPGRPYEIAIDDTNNAIYVRTLDGFVGAYATRELLDQCAPDPPTAAPVPTPIGQASSGGVAFEPPSMSSDGRYVAYTTGVTPQRQVHIRDLETKTIRSLPATDPVAPSWTRTDKHHPVLSADGRYVGFIARQRDTVNNWVAEMMFVQDLQTGDVEPVLRHPNGTAMSVQMDGLSTQPTDRRNFAMAMSRDGRKVAFVSNTNGLVAGDADGAADLFVVDRVSGTRTRIAKGFSPALSADGRYVVFDSSTNLTGATLPAGAYDRQTPYLYRYDLQTNELVNVSALADGTMVTGYSGRPSADGRYVVYVSGAPSLYPVQYREPDPGWYGYSQGVFVWDSTTGRSEYVSPNASGLNGRVALTRPVLSDDARQVVWQVPGLFTKGMVGTARQIVGRDRVLAKTQLLSYNGWGTGSNGESVAPTMSADGSRFAFISAASDLAPDDGVGGYDLFVYDRAREGLQPAEPAEFGDASCPLAGDDARAYGDLRVAPSDIEGFGLEQGQTGDVRVTVHNDGGAVTEPTTVQLFEGDTLIGERPLAAIPGGASLQATFTWERIASAGPHTLRAVVDPDGLVYEQDLADNEAEGIVEVTAPRLDLAVETDHPAYGANAPVAVTASLSNLSGAGRDVRVRVAIEDEAGDEIAELHDADAHLGAGDDLSVPATWNTQDTTAGAYVVRARAENAGGDELATATAPLTIEPDVRAALELRTGRRVYEANDTAALSAVVENLSVNSSLSGAEVEIAIASTGDAWELPAGEIMLGRSTLVSQERAVRGLAPGTYPVTAVLRAADGAQLATDTAQLVVASTADTGAGLAGTIAAEPQNPHRFAKATFPYSVTNDGNADVAGATVRVRISDLDSGALLHTLDAARTLTRAAPAAGSLATVADMPAGRDYQVSLHAVLPSGAERALDRTIIHVRPKLLDHGLSVDPTPRERVLVWACEAADDAAARAALGTGTFAAFVIDRSDSRYATLPGCGVLRDEELAKFRRLMRSGDFNQFWLLGRSLPFDLGVIDDELAARVIQGDGLLVAGGVPSLGVEPFLGANRSPLGATLSGALVPPLGHYMSFTAGSPFGGLTDAEVNGPFPGLKLEGATAISTTRWTNLFGQFERATSGALNRFGNGTAVFFSPAPNAYVRPSDAIGVLRRAAQALRPAADPLRASGIAWLDLFVQGIAPGSPLELRTQLPGGTTLPRPPADATFAGGSLTLPFDAAGEQRKTRGLWLKLPPLGGDLSFSSSVFYRDADDGQMHLYGEPATATVNVAEDKSSARTAALAALGAVTTPNAAEQAKLQKIKDDVSATAVATTDAATLEARLDALLTGIGTLEQAAWTNTGPARTAVARLVTYVAYDHYRTGGA